MSSAELNSAPARNWPEVQAAPLIVGGSLIGIGAAAEAVTLLEAANR